MTKQTFLPSIILHASYQVKPDQLKADLKVKRVYKTREYHTHFVTKIRANSKDPADVDRFIHWLFIRRAIELNPESKCLHELTWQTYRIRLTCYSATLKDWQKGMLLDKIIEQYESLGRPDSFTFDPHYIC